MKNLFRTLSVSILLCVLLCGSFIPGVNAASSKDAQRTNPSGKEYSTLRLIPGGFPFGVKFTTEGVLIVGFCDIEANGATHNPAREAGLRIKDVLTHVGDEPIASANDLTQKINASGGTPITIRYKRGGKAGTATMTALADPAGNGYKTGLYVRDSGAGIGTVTFLMPKTNAFAGLGHGICDVDTGELMPLHRGNVVDVTISGVHRGVAGTPGELRGYFGTNKNGTLLGNTACGVFGLYRELPKNITAQPCSIATRDEIHEGEVTILCTLATNECQSYTARIYALDKDAKGSKCFTIQITDPSLLEQTGGIVQGMSGSPILQDGKLIGAVTHVLINNPTTGYGIFIENMLEQMGELAG